MSFEIKNHSYEVDFDIDLCAGNSFPTTVKQICKYIDTQFLITELWQIKDREGKNDPQFD